MTVGKASPAIITDASPLHVALVNAGLDLADTATLSNGQNPTGTITFHLYADNGSGGCGSELAGSPLTKTVNGNGSYTSGTVHVSSAGTYHWVATYGGDANNGTVAGSCGDANENVAVVDGRIAITPLTPTNEVGHAHTFTVTVLKNDGSGGYLPDAGVKVTATATASNGATVSNPTPRCVSGSPATETTDANGQCTITVNSSTAGKITVHVTSTFVVGGVTLTRARVTRSPATAPTRSRPTSTRTS